MTGLQKLLIGKVAQGGPAKLKAGSKITQKYLDSLKRTDWFEIRVKNEKTARELEAIREQIAKRKEILRPGV